MKNITISIADEAAEWARIEAARRNSSVSRMLGEILHDKMLQDDAYAVAMKGAVEFKTWGIPDGPYLTRDQIYDRANLR